MYTYTPFKHKHLHYKTITNYQQTATTSFSLYAGPVTKHPLIQKYLYWPIRESSSSSTTAAAATSPSSKSYNYQEKTDDKSSVSDRNRTSSYQVENGNKERHSTSKSPISQSVDISGSRSSYSSPKHSSVYSRLLAGSRTLSFGRYGNRT